MISHIGLLGRRRSISALASLPRWIGVPVMALFVYLYLVLFGTLGMKIKYDNLNIGYWQNSTSNHCEAERYLKAGSQAVDDMTLNPFSMFYHWGTDYLARQPQCPRSAQ